MRRIARGNDSKCLGRIDSQDRSRDSQPMPRFSHSVRVRIPQPLFGTLLLLLTTANSLGAGESTNAPLLTLDRIFSSGDFKAESYGPVVWRTRGPGYYLLEKPENKDKSGKDVVKIDPSSGHREIVIPAHLLTPPRESSPLSIDDF